MIIRLNNDCKCTFVRIIKTMICVAQYNVHSKQKQHECGGLLDGFMLEELCLFSSVYAFIYYFKHEMSA